MRGVFGSNPQMWGGRLSQEQRDRWNVAGPQVMSHPRLSQCGPLTGQQHFEQVNCILGCVGLPPVWEPPARVVFGLSPVGQLVITNGEGGVRLWLMVKGDVTTDIMVFGQEPCSAGRNKRRNVCYLGLLPPSKDGMSEITDLYKARYGKPRPGKKVFVVTCQQKNGWKGIEQETSEIVPETPISRISAEEGAHRVADGRSEGENSQKALMHKGGTQGDKGNATAVDRPSPDRTETGEGGEKAAGAGLEGRAVPGREGDTPV
jgi:hypothetical protein